MSNKKSIAVVIMLVLVLLIGGMLAYFTDEETITNVFTFGDDVNISLTETNWSNGGSGTTYTYASATGIHPGAVVSKDPTINNISTTVPAYVFAEIIVPCYDSDADNVADSPLFVLNSIGTGWTILSTSAIDTTNKTITYVYYYGTSGSMTSLAASASTTPVFSSVTLESSLTAAQQATAGTTNIVVNAYGIQTDNLSSNSPAGIYALFHS